MMAEGPSANRPPHIALEELTLLKTTYRSAMLAVLVAGALAGCDNGAGDEAQGGDQVSSETGAEDFTGTIDRTFAGDMLPEVTLIDPDGTTLALAEAAGTPILLNLWATWCAPCVAEMPMLDELAAEMDGQVRVLTVSEDINGAEAVVPFFERHGLANLPRWMDSTNDLAFKFGGGASLPLTVLYDAEGKEVWRMIGAYHWTSEDARVLIAEGLPGGA
ncbi:TlpA family protein disulfide reductase [Altererythrobacter sp. KTW20L]|uniref:TlpA family protein disulfide reductase n=1 Tax=Altererythrobacter sp. KTW20L TaxID=2942210 RepID=UPI0020BDA353|nr:TlpA disulfide reductase family protein [Altererythrobacter sp. KTW20L]MCL6250681.1 TlpA family protein disulfide reductase [Altererythrobacter sp. KTW20L]